MRNTRTYSDFSFAFIPHPRTKDISVSIDEDAVKQSIRNLILTKNYERPFRSQIGSQIYGLLFEPVSPMTSILMKRTIIDCINNFEPRAILLDTDVIYDGDNNVNVNITFKIRNTESPISISIILERTR
jgi:phage baseplate assembly protein W